MNFAQERRTVAIVGGGLAGLAAGCALSDAGFEITLYERRPYLGGRASSYEHPGTGEIVDNCQHVLLGCCTNLIDFYRRIGVENQIRWYDGMTFIEPGGRQSSISVSGLPAPLQAAPSFLRASALSTRDKLAIARAMLALVPGLPKDGPGTFLDWLQAHRQTEQAIERFWKVVLVSALNEDLDRVSVRSAALVFRESFLKSPQAGRMGVPTVPLTELYGKAGDYITLHGGGVKLRSSVAAMRNSDDGIELCANGEDVASDYAITAVPFDMLQRIMPEGAEGLPLRMMLSKFETSPITGVHLWFDREITNLEHAVLLDRTIQWMFHKSRIQRREPTVNTSSAGSYVELVVSASKSLVPRSRSEIIDLAVRELAEFFPAVRDAKLLKATVIKEINATYAPKPGSDAHRPGSVTPWPQVFLAGDWTATGWPATMESAVRSGYAAAEAVCRAAGVNRKFLVADLPASGLMRLFR